MKKAFTKNIKIVFILRFLRHFAFMGGIFNLFLIERGFGIADLAIYFTLRRMAQMFFEIPVGYIINIIGRKRGLQLSRLSILGAFTILAVTDNYAIMMVAAVLDGLCNAFYSDTDTSLIYDELKQKRQEKLYSRLLARYNLVGMIAFSIASIIGATLANHFYSHSLIFTFYMTIPVYITHIILTNKIKETVNISQRSKNMLLSPFNIFSTGFKNIVGNKNLLKVVYFSSILFAFHLIVWDYWQNYGQIIELPLYIFGWIAFIFSMAEAGPQFISHRFFKPKNFTKLYIVVSVMVFTLGLGSSILANHLGLALLIGATIITGFSFPISDAIFHYHIKSKDRNILCSFNRLIQMMTYTICTLFFGVISDRYSIFAGLAFISSLVLMATIIYTTIHFLKPKKYRYKFAR
ncbi:MAG: MFS transporter [Pseudomonadales bacterium]|jgi:hypothetical protein|nr:MFS transporter [Pseudomonadales bacterium]